MATLANYIILNEYAQDSFRYADTTFKQILNEQTGGTITTQVRPTDGNFFSKAVWANDANQFKLVKPSVNTAVTAKEQRRLQCIDIKCAGNMGQFEWQSIAARWVGISPEEQAAVWGRTVAESIMRTKIELLVGGLVATFCKALSAGGSTGAKDTEIEKVVQDESGSTAANDKRMDLAKLVKGQGLFGDAWGMLNGAIMHSGAYFNMYAENLRSFSEVFMYGNSFVTRAPTGLMIFVTDVPALKYVESSVTKYRTLFLRPMAATIYENADHEMLIDRTTGTEWINTTAQAQQTFNIGISGMTWANVANVEPITGTTAATGKLAGLHTNAGVIDNPASWERVGTDETQPITFKELPGAMIISQ